MIVNQTYLEINSKPLQNVNSTHTITSFVTAPIYLFTPLNFRTRLCYLALNFCCVGLRVIVFFNFRTFCSTP